MRARNFSKSKSLLREGKVGNFSKSQSLFRGAELRIFPSPKASIEGAQETKYEGKMKKYEGNMVEYIEKFRASQQKGGGKSYADAYADTIPGMAPTTERECGSPAKSLMSSSRTSLRLVLRRKPAFKGAGEPGFSQFLNLGESLEFSQIPQLIWRRKLEE